MPSCAIPHMGFAAVPLDSLGSYRFLLPSSSWLDKDAMYIIELNLRHCVLACISLCLPRLSLTRVSPRYHCSHWGGIVVRINLYIIDDLLFLMRHRAIARRQLADILGNLTSSPCQLRIFSVKSQVSRTTTFWLAINLAYALATSLHSVFRFIRSWHASLHSASAILFSVARLYSQAYQSSSLQYQSRCS